MSKFVLAILFLTVACTCLAGTCSERPKSRSEQNGLLVEPPLENIKNAFIVTDSERDIVGIINAASTSISRFALEVYDLQFHPSRDSLKQVLPESRNSLRLPPELSHNIRGRYVATAFYCWKRIDDNHLQVLIEWGDIATRRRYADSYIFKKTDTEWYFERHGNFGPLSFLPAERIYKRNCNS